MRKKERKKAPTERKKERKKESADRNRSPSRSHAQEQHAPFVIFRQLGSGLVEAVHAELVRLATELEAVKGQVQTECNAL